MLVKGDVKLVAGITAFVVNAKWNCRFKKIYKKWIYWKEFIEINKNRVTVEVVVERRVT